MEVWCVEDDSTASLSVAEIATQSHVVNAYLEDEKTIVVKLSNTLTLPFAASDVLATNQTQGTTLAVTGVDIVQPQQVVLCRYQDGTSERESVSVHGGFACWHV